MQLRTFLSLLAFGFTATALPVSENPAAVLSKRDDTFSCAGSGLCSWTPNLRRACDGAVNNGLRRGFPSYMYAASTDGVDAGTCERAQTGNGCGVFLEGPPDCKGSGDDLWWGYQQIRAAGCGICGSKSFTGEQGGACTLRVDYVQVC